MCSRLMFPCAILAIASSAFATAYPLPVTANVSAFNPKVLRVVTAGASNPPQIGIASLSATASEPTPQQEATINSGPNWSWGVSAVEVYNGTTWVPAGGGYSVSIATSGDDPSVAEASFSATVTGNYRVKFVAGCWYSDTAGNTWSGTSTPKTATVDVGAWVAVSPDDCSPAVGANGDTFYEETMPSGLGGTSSTPAKTKLTVLRYNWVKAFAYLRSRAWAVIPGDSTGVVSSGEATWKTVRKWSHGSPAPQTQFVVQASFDWAISGEGDVDTGEIGVTGSGKTFAKVKATLSKNPSGSSKSLDAISNISNTEGSEIQWSVSIPFGVSVSGPLVPSDEWSSSEGAPDDITDDLNSGGQNLVHAKTIAYAQASAEHSTSADSQPHSCEGPFSANASLVVNSIFITEQ